MKSMLFKNIHNAGYKICRTIPTKRDCFFVEITDIPDENTEKEVESLLNQTVVHVPQSAKNVRVRYEQLGLGKLVNTHGGARAGAGRPEVEEKRTQRSVSFSDIEWGTIKENAEAEKLGISEYIRQKVLGE